MNIILLTIQELVAIGMILAVPVIAPVKIAAGLIGEFFAGLF